MDDEKMSERVFRDLCGWCNQFVDTAIFIFTLCFIALVYSVVRIGVTGEIPIGILCLVAVAVLVGLLLIKLTVRLHKVLEPELPRLLSETGTTDH